MCVCLADPKLEWLGIGCFLLAALPQVVLLMVHVCVHMFVCMIVCVCVYLTGVGSGMPGGNYDEGPDFVPNSTPSVVREPPLEEHLAQVCVSVCDTATRSTHVTCLCLQQLQLIRL